MSWGKIVINFGCFIGITFHFVLTKNQFGYFVEIFHFTVGGNIIGYNFVENLMGVIIIKGFKNHVKSQWKQSNFVYMFMHWHLKIMVNMGNCVKGLIWMLKSSKHEFFLKNSRFGKGLLNLNNNSIKYGKKFKGFKLKTLLMRKFWSKCFWENNNLLYTFKNTHNVKDVGF